MTLPPELHPFALLHRLDSTLCSQYRIIELYSLDEDRIKRIALEFLAPDDWSWWWQRENE